MVIGNGLVAKSFKKYRGIDEFVIFASGVSDSKHSTENDFLREKELLLETIDQNRSKKIVYFSTCSIEDPDLKETVYVKHKSQVEQIIRENALHYFIFRLSNLAGRTGNPHTILNFFYFHIAQETPFEVWADSERNIVDVEDVVTICDHILTNNLFTNRVLNIANPRNYAVLDIVRSMEEISDKKAIFTQIRKGAKFKIDISLIRPILEVLDIEFGEHYLRDLLKKYYS
jgi:nucleoside-diphosphate-sugar epimerase